MEEILAAVSSYASFFLIVVTVITAIFILSAIVLFWLFGKKGMTSITDNGPRWFKVLSLLGAIVTALVIGIVIGFQVGATRTGLKVVNDAGSLIVDRGLELAGQRIGLVDIHQEIDIGKAKEAIAEVRKLQLMDSGGMDARIVNGAFSVVRTPFIEEAEGLLNQYAPNEKILLTDVAANTWNDVYSNIKSTNNTIVLSKIGIGYIWLFVFGITAMLITWISKKAAVRAKSGLDKIKAG